MLQGSTKRQIKRLGVNPSSLNAGLPGPGERNPEFFKDYKKITGETPTPMMPDEFEMIIKKLPRNPEDVDLYKKLAGAGPLPDH